MKMDVTSVGEVRESLVFIATGFYEFVSYIYICAGKGRKQDDL